MYQYNTGCVLPPTNILACSSEVCSAAPQRIEKSSISCYPEYMGFAGNGNTMGSHKVCRAEASIYRNFAGHLMRYPFVLGWYGTSHAPLLHSGLL
jgi:hypothetical protein